MKKKERGVGKTPKKDLMSEEYTVSQLNNARLLLIIHAKFLKYLIKKHGVNTKVSVHDLYSVLACLFSFNRRETRFYLRMLAETFDFVHINRYNLVVEVPYD